MVLLNICRVRGGRFSNCTHTTKDEAKRYTSSLQKVFGIDVTNDQHDVHPQHFCSKCERVMARVLAGGPLSGGGCSTPVTIPVTGVLGRLSR